MKPLCFFVQNNYIQRVTAPVAIYARERGYELVDRSCMPDFNPDNLDIDWSAWHPILPVGSVQFLRALRSSPAFTEYIHHEEESFSSTRCVQEFGTAMLNHGGELLKVKDVVSVLEKGRRHIRPSHVDKAFTAKVFDKESWHKTVEEKHLKDDLLCWVSQEHQITGEWRCWVVGNEVVDISRYREDDHMAINRDVPLDVWDFAKQHVQGWLPAQIVVMDIARTPHGLKLIEFNPFHSSGWYAGDVSKVLDAWVTWANTFYNKLENSSEYTL